MTDEEQNADSVIFLRDTGKIPARVSDEQAEEDNWDPVSQAVDQTAMLTRAAKGCPAVGVPRHRGGTH
jgi:hypothetical protein